MGRALVSPGQVAMSSDKEYEHWAVKKVDPKEPEVSNDTGLCDTCGGRASASHVCLAFVDVDDRYNPCLRGCSYGGGGGKVRELTPEQIQALEPELVSRHQSSKGYTTTRKREDIMATYKKTWGK